MIKFYWPEAKLRIQQAHRTTSLSLIRLDNLLRKEGSLDFSDTAKLLSPSLHPNPSWLTSSLQGIRHSDTKKQRPIFHTMSSRESCSPPPSPHPYSGWGTTLQKGT